MRLFNHNAGSLAHGIHVTTVNLNGDRTFVGTDLQLFQAFVHHPYQGIA